MSTVRYIVACAILLVVASPVLMQSQEMVVSEYYNIQDVNSEWTELVVVKDDLNAVGWILTDANTGQVTRQGGPRFNDIPLWRHLRAGTIIVLWHRSLPVTVLIDTVAADGYLEMSARDVKFFSTFYFAPPSSLSDLNIADAGDVLQIIKSDTLTHVHALGHMKPAGAAYVSIPAPKVNFDSGAVGAGRSNRVTGRTLGAYGADLTKDSAVGGFNDSKGLPNRFDLARTNQGIPNINHWFWRETREPQWSSTPTISVVSISAQRHVIEWTPLIDTYQQDSTTGYVILRDTLNFSSFPTNSIRDGQMITKGSRLGSSLILDVRPSAFGLRYIDSLNLLCGQSYTYRVYGYRYRKDDQMANTDDTTARGRQYTELRFAQSSVLSKPNPVKPLIQASRVEFCPGDTSTLTTSAVADRYEWTVNGAPVSVGGTTRIVVREPGVYRLTIIVDGGCTSTSDPIKLSLLRAQEVDISPIGTQTICATDSVVFTALTDAPSYQWLRDGNVITGATYKKFTARTPGDYQVRVASSVGCPGISQHVRVKIPDVRYRFEPNNLNFGVLGQCKSDTTLSLELVNEGMVSITVTSATFPPGYALTFPAPGFVVRVGERQTVQILFTPASAGVVTGTATFTVVPCNITSSFNVRGERTRVSAALDRARVDFGTYSLCPGMVVRPDSTFRITNSGSSTITVHVPRVDPPFYLLTDFPAPISVPPGGSLPIKMQYRPLGPDRDRGVIQQILFPFSSATCNDTLRAQLQAASYRPEYIVEGDSIDVGVVLSCSTSFDTSFTITNPKPIPVTITGVVGTGWSFIGNATTIDPNTSRSIPVRIQPVASPGAFAMYALITAEPCAMNARIRAEGVVIAPWYSSATSTIEFNSDASCPPPQPVLMPSYIVAKGLSGLRSAIHSVKISAPFTTDIVVGRTFIDTLRFNVTFSPPGTGVYTDSLVVDLGPCRSPLSININGVVLSRSRITTISSTDFGTLAPGQTSTQTIHIANTGTDTLSVAALEGIVAPFRIQSSSPLPSLLNLGEWADVVIAYDFTGYDRRDSIKIISRTLLDCADTITLSVRGATVSPSLLTGLVVSAPTNIVGKAGSGVAVPLSFESLVALDSANIRKIDVYVSYDPSLLKAITVDQGASGAQGTVVETSPGKAYISITSASPIVAVSPLVVVNMRTYVSSTNTSVFAIDSVIAPGAVVTGRNGAVTVIADCLIDATLASIGPLIQIHVLSLRAQTLETSITTLTDDPANVSLYDVTGRHVVTLVSSHLPVGSFSMVLDISQVQAGSYVLVYQHGRHLLSKSIYLYR